ncbi:MAG TPA: hypothetical protein VN887_03205 [Candidatus Angelobacter sp.]|nr:hypothetical protein [Candidatus Angelobacter sp.]
MAKKKLVTERDLAALAQKLRLATGKSRAQAARELGVARQAVIYAEDHPKKSFTKLRRRMIESFSKSKVNGPYFQIDER